MPTIYPDPLRPLSRTGLGGQSFKIRIGPSAGFQFRRLSLRSLSRSGQTHSGEMDSSISENQPSFETMDLLSQTVHVSNRSSDNHRKTGGVGTTSYETHSVAFKEILACLRSPGKGHSSAQVSAWLSALVVRSKQCSERSTTTPLTSRPPVVYRRLK